MAYTNHNFAFDSALTEYEGTVIYYDKDKGRGALWYGNEKLSFTYDAFKDPSVWVKAHDKVKFSLRTVYSTKRGTYRKVVNLTNIKTGQTDEDLQAQKDKAIKSDICPHCEQVVIPSHRLNTLICPKCGGVIRYLSVDVEPPMYQVRWLKSPWREMWIGGWTIFFGSIVMIFIIG